MGEGLTNMDGVNQYVRRQASNSPTLGGHTKQKTLPGNSGKSVSKAKSGQAKNQKFGKPPCPPTSGGQRNSYPTKSRGRGNQNPQRQGNLADKRPPSRGFKQTERYQQLSVEDKDCDLEYDFPVASWRKGSLNHLLNFTFAAREQVQYVSPRRKGASKEIFNKEQFLQANCQFVVQDGGNYAVNNIDPDAIVDWELIEQVRVRCTEMPSCPICLYPPTAAQVTRCGHIYCWSCILHYLSLSDKTWRKCPICYESVHKNDLKSVMAVSDHKHSHGQEITMVLMKRPKSSVRALPYSKWVENETLPHLASDEVELQFSKFIRATPNEILTQIMAKVRSELQSMLAELENEESDEKQFVDLAMDEFQKREQRLLDMCKKDEEKLSGSCQGVLDQEEVDVEKVEDKVKEGDGTTLLSVEDEFITGRDQRISVSSDDSNKSSTSPQFYYFYQAADGQQIFLHPVNARCLTKEYGSLENCPETITGRIVEMECLTQTEQLRRRFAYLRHLPLTCEFAVCELDLKPPILSKDTLSFFKDDLRKRRARRQKKAKDEAKHENKCRSNFEPYTGIKQQPSVKYNETPDLSSEHDFPQQVSSPSVWVASASPTSGPWSTNTPPASEIESSQSAGQSFAEALSTGRPKQANIVVKSKAQRNGRYEEDLGGENSEDEGDVVPSFQSAFNEALMLADWNLNVEAVSKDERPQNVSGKKNKKKNNKRLLFSTGSSCRKL